MKAKSVNICVFTNAKPTAAGSYSVDMLPSMERALYNSVSNAASALAAQGYEGTILSVCNANAPEFAQFMAANTIALPFVSIVGTFPDGSMKYYSTRNTNQVKDLIKAMWVGEFGGSGNTTNPGDGNGGWGDGESLICKVFPPLCALGFLPWVLLAGYTTYRAAEARSTTGRAVWAVPAFLFWQGFIAKGGVKQIQWWVKNGGIGKIGEQPFFEYGGKKLEIIATVRYDTGKRPNLEKEMKEKGIVATHWLSTKQSVKPKYSVNEYSNGVFGKITAWR